MTEASYSFHLVLTCCVVSIGSSSLFGFNIGVINTPAEIIRQYYITVYKERNGEEPSKNLLTWLWSLTVSMWVLGGMFGAFASGLVCDMVGRKRALWLNNIFMFIGCFLEAMPLFVYTIEAVIIGRFFAGINCGFTVGAASLYLTEIAPKVVRGFIGATHQLLVVLGILLAQILGLRQLLGTETMWPVLLACSAIPSILSMLVLPFCPESPRFLMLMRHDEEGAREALMKFRGNKADVVNSEIEEMRKEQQQKTGEEKHEDHVSILQVLKRADLRLPLLIAVTLQILQQLSGVNAIFSFSEGIFRDAGVKEDDMPYWVMSTGLTFLVTTIFGMPLLEKWGRRPLAIWPSFLMILAMLMLCVSLNLTDNSKLVAENFANETTGGYAIGGTTAEPLVNVTGWSYISIICVFTFVIGFALGAGPIPALIVAELFRQDARSAAMSLAQFANWTSHFLLTFTFRFLKESIGPYVFLIFTAIIVGCISFLYLFAPETKNRSFEDIATCLSHGFVTVKNQKAYAAKDGTDEEACELTKPGENAEC